ncbi:MAG TPA: nucleoside monophosphate kinase [Candidatus Paceibacterota bacterium]|nr:nucleoside monophosphate kinase [Candidatus Paceibacterota bacterium]
MNQQTLIFLGPQGSGKGTHAVELQSDLARLDPSRPVVHFEMGRNLRDIAAQDSYTGTLLREIINRGELVPFNVSSAVLSTYLMQHLQGNEHLIIDGFPRSDSQMEVLDATMAFYKREHPTVVHINISDEEGLKRLLLRGRADDTEENIRKRLAWTRAEWEKILARFKANPIYRILEIDGDRTIAEVHEDILKQLNFA